MEHEGRMRDDMRRWLAFTRSGTFWTALALSLVAYALPPSPGRPGLAWLAAMAVLEELVFRAGLQEMLRRHLAKRDWKRAGWAANGAASLVFAAAHLFAHPPLWAAGVLFPSLVFGHVWNRTRSLAACSIVHFVYNFLYFWRPFTG